MKYRCLVADDNLIDRDLILQHLKKIGSIEVVAICSDGHEAAIALEQHQIDIVFSDIDMPDLSGIGLRKGLRNPPVFVFITSHFEYAVESFNLDIVDFVVKPLTFERFYKAANKAIEYLELKDAVGKANGSSMLKPEDEIRIREANSSDYFFIKETQGITKIRYSEVLYIESLGDYSKIFSVDNMHVTLINLKNLEKQLPDALFMRIHKQFIVGLEHVVTITANEAHLSNKQIVPLSAVSRQELIDRVVNDRVLSRSGE
ncbi:MAG: hypothetical protein K0S09_1259 [Sphingobacteriaceae bacterium]|jgi:DNA-binding LytR/AlgR family response regulator|nr:hypothetical protein [Sphingobacteriaceae bacterium]